jgi:hypothetical protein
MSGKFDNSRRGLAMLAREARQARQPTLAVLRAAHLRARKSRRRNGCQVRTREPRKTRRLSMT